MLVTCDRKLMAAKCTEKGFGCWGFLKRDEACMCAAWHHDVVMHAGDLDRTWKSVVTYWKLVESFPLFPSES